MAYLAGPFYPNHPPDHAPRGHHKADLIDKRCPKCGSELVGAAGWVWCFDHDHPTEDSIVYSCDYERKL